MNPARLALALLAAAALCAAAAAGGPPGGPGHARFDESLLADGRQYKGAGGSGVLPPGKPAFNATAPRSHGAGGAGMEGFRHGPGGAFNASRLRPAFNAAGPRFHGGEFGGNHTEGHRHGLGSAFNASRVLPAFNASAATQRLAQRWNASGAALPKFNASALAQRMNATLAAAPAARNATGGWGGSAARVQRALGGRRALSL